MKAGIILFNFVLMLVFAKVNESSIDNFSSSYIYVLLFTALQAVCVAEMITTFAYMPTMFVLSHRMVILIEVGLTFYALLGYIDLFQFEFESIRDGMRKFEVILVIRLVRIGTLLKEIRIFRNMHEFFVKMTTPLAMMAFSMYFFFYCFAVIGNTMLGGKVSNQSA